MPKYAKIRAELESEILHSLHPRDPLPSERELMDRFRVSRMTIRQAMDSLESDGLIYRIQGSGTFVSGRTTIRKSPRLSSFTEDMRERGHVPESRTISKEITLADSLVAGDLGLLQDAVVFRLKRLRMADGSPIAVEETYFNNDLVDGLIHDDVSGSLHELLAEKYGIELDSADQSVSAIRLSDSDARLLGETPGAPGLMVCSVGMNRRGTPVEKATTIYRADRFSFNFNITKR
nr:GntR family transcriptional regulator [Arthrobacter sp. SDTb3-6]